MNWRTRAQLRRRARRRYLAFVHSRWRAAGAPRHAGRPSQTLVTLLWLVVPIAVAAGGAAVVWLVSAKPASPALPAGLDPRLLAVLLLVPILGVVVLRRR